MEDMFIRELRSRLQAHARERAPVALRSAVASITRTQPTPGATSTRVRVALRGLAGISLVAIVIGATFSLQHAPRPTTDGGMNPLPLEVQADPAGATKGVVVCSQALHVVRIGLADSRLTFTAPDTGEELALVFPAGFTAREVDGHAELVAPDGTVAGLQGETITLSGGLNADGSAIDVCSVNGTIY